MFVEPGEVRFGVIWGFLGAPLERIFPEAQVPRGEAPLCAHSSLCCLRASDCARRIKSVQKEKIKAAMPLVKL